ncbi:MAG: hypothetical protein FJ100_00055 [Deltaproteobacteria bacterium]|nr:hypothetical protein [Deltaproteobacteria bacterium]
MELMVLYGLVGAGCAVVMVQRSGTVPGPARWATDAALLLLLWPLYGPLLFAQTRPVVPIAPATGPAADLIAALRAAEGTALATLLPDAATARLLLDRLERAVARVRDIEALLHQPTFDDAAAATRIAAMQAGAASATAIRTAQLRRANIARLHAMRDRAARDIEEVHELIAQLQTQAELVRLAGAADADTAGLVRELVCRVEGLDGVLDEPEFTVPPTAT